MHDIFLFNPTGEMAIANGTNSYTPPKRLQIFEDNLATITSFFAEENDYIITKDFEDRKYLNNWHELGLPNLNYITLSETTNLKNIHSLRPWSWNQVSHTKFKNIKNNCSEQFKNSPNFNWTPDYKMFFSRQTTNNIQNIISNSDHSSSIISIQQPAICISNYDDFCVWLEKNPKAILKMPWSSSGRGIQMIDMLPNKPCNKDWVKGAIRQQGFITAEPLLDRQQDFSFQFQIKANGQILFKGISYSINDTKAHFIGGNINQTPERQTINSFLTQNVIDQTVDILTTALQSINAHHFYEGPFGIDAISYKNKDGDIKIHPCVDINWRYNMGIINVMLPKFVNETSSGRWGISSFINNDWNLFVSAKQKQNPLCIKNNKIVSGFIPLTPSIPNARFGAWMEIQ